jgi:TRAP-type mannitol/chloroaromatic compound transport system substrate-binding protein
VENPRALERLVAGGTQLRRFPDDMLRAAHRTATDIMEQHASRDATYRKVYGEWKQFRDHSFRWFGTAEQAYASFAFGGASGNAAL